MLRWVSAFAVCVLIGCGGGPEQPAATPAPVNTFLEIVAEFETDWEGEREYCAETAGRYVLETSAPDGEPLASVHLYRPDATGETPSSLWRKSRIRPGPGAVEFRTLNGMAMGKRPAARQASPMWVDTADLPTNHGHPFFERLNRVLEDCGFDAFVEELCATFYADRLGRPSLRPGRYFRKIHNSPWNKVVGGLTPVEGVRI